MKYFSKGLIFFVALLMGVSQAAAGEWQIVGPRALGMGGANVAVANDATASYWNPGAFGFFDHSDGGDYGNRGWSSSLDVGVGAQLLGGLGTQIGKISDIDFDGVSDGTVEAGKVSDFISLLDTLKSFDENMAMHVLGNGGLRIQSGHFGIGGVFFLDITASPKLDLKNLAPSDVTNFSIDEFTNPVNLGCNAPCPTADGTGSLSSTDITELRTHLEGNLKWSPLQANNYINSVDNGLSQPGGVNIPPNLEQIKDAATLANDAVNASGGSIKDNQSKLAFRGIDIREVPLTYGHALTENFSIGGNIKYMKARVYTANPRLFDEDLGDSLDTALEDYEEKSNFGIDLGMLYRFNDNLRVGLVGRNLNSPKFGNFTERAQLRTGLAYKPVSSITIAADLDLTKNGTLLPGAFKSQNIGAGLEVSLFNFLMLRGGAYKNIANNDIGLVYTAGLGINLWLINIDVGLSQSEKETDLDGDSIPEEVKGAFAISMLF